MESLIGWGIGVVTGLPLLLGTGISKLRAIQIALLGLMLCPWGAFAPTLILVSELTGIDMRTIGTTAALYNIPVIAVLGCAIVIVGGGIRAGARMWIEAAATVAVMSAVLVVTNALVTPVLGGIFASFAGALTLIGFAAVGSRSPKWMPALAMRGFMPYAVVLAGLVGSTVVANSMPDGVLTALLTNPAVWLTVGLVVAPPLVNLSGGALAGALRRSAVTWAPVCAVTVLLIVFGTLLGVTGMSDTLAEGAAKLGSAFVYTVPVIGFIAGFVTTSNTAAAALLTEPLRTAALSVGANPVQVLGMQTAVSGAAIMCAPARVVLAVETAHMVRPGEDAKPTVAAVLKPALLANAVILVVVIAASALG